MDIRLKQAYYNQMRQQQVYRAYIAGINSNPKMKTLKVTWGTDGTEVSLARFQISVNGKEFVEGEFDKEYQFQEGTLISLKAISETVVQFVKWDDGNTENPRLITLNDNTELKAIFHQNWS